jgi:hypothetical protein
MCVAGMRAFFERVTSVHTLMMMFLVTSVIIVGHYDFINACGFHPRTVVSLMRIGLPR